MRFTSAIPLAVSLSAFTLEAAALPFGLDSVSSWFGRSTPSEKRATVCNGHPELCGRSYGNVTYLGSHNSYAYSEDLLSLARCQEVDVPTQLGLGVRLLQGQAHMNGNVLHLCHTNCLLFDGGPLVDYLTTVKTWLDANPNEVLTLILTNPDAVSLPNYWKPAFDQSGMTPYIYNPPNHPTSRNAWPTLGQLIDSNQRVIFFMDYNLDNSVPWILAEFDNVWENPFSVTDKTFPCSVDRISGPLSTPSHMNLINHVLNVNILPIGDGVLISDPIDAPTTNSVASILADANGCSQFVSGLAPNFVLLDYVNIGQGLQAVTQLNGL